MRSPDIVFSLTGDIGCNSRALKQLRELVSLGASVTVLHLGPDSVESMPDGVRVKALQRPADSGPRFFAAVHRRFAEAARAFQSKVYHASDLYTLPAMGRAASEHDGLLAYDARELYPHVASTAGRPWVRAVWRTVEYRHIRRADAVFTVGDAIADVLHRSYSITRPIVVHNVPEHAEPAPTDALRTKAGAEANIVILLHQGNIQKHRGCSLMVDAMTSVEGAMLVFLGGGPLKEELRRKADRRGLANKVRFIDPVPPAGLLSMTASADIGITLLEDTCLNHRLALPNKLFEYLMAGLPVLASNLPEAGSLVNRFEVGMTVDPADTAALAETIQYMVDNTGARTRWAGNSRKVFSEFSWETASARFRSAYQNLLAK